MNTQPKYIIDEELEPGLRYTEHTMPTGKGECRVCSLFRTGDKEPVSRLKLYSFAIRFGAVSVDAEGFGGVSTEKAERRKGYLGKLFRRTLAGIRERVCVAFLYGVESLYQKYGFTACLPETKLTIWVQRLLETGVVGGLEFGSHVGSDWNLEPYADAKWELEPRADRYVGEIISLYNTETAMRPWSRVRTKKEWPRLVHGETWRPGPECFVLTRRGEFEGYAFIAGTNYGWMPRTYEVVELAAKSNTAAAALMLELGKESWGLYCQNLVLREPPDGRCGTIAKSFSCEVEMNFNERGGGMGAILHRAQLLNLLKEELERRASYGKLSLDDTVFEELCDSSLIPDDGHLMRLLTGYWSWREAEIWGAVAAEDRRKLFGSIFPGGPSPALPMPYAHSLDRY